MALLTCAKRYPRREDDVNSSRVHRLTPIRDDVQPISHLRISTQTQPCQKIYAAAQATGCLIALVTTAALLWLPCVVGPQKRSHPDNADAVRNMASSSAAVLSCPERQ
jgi:hypothetical protein